MADAAVTEAKETVVGWVPGHLELFTLRQLAADDTYWRDIHASIDISDVFDPMSEHDRNAKLEAIEQEKHDLRRELDLRPRLAEREALDREIEAIAGQAS